MWKKLSKIIIFLLKTTGMFVFKMSKKAALKGCLSNNMTLYSHLLSMHFYLDLIDFAVFNEVSFLKFGTFLVLGGSGE